MIELDWQPIASHIYSAEIFTVKNTNKPCRGALILDFID